MTSGDLRVPRLHVLTDVVTQARWSHAALAAAAAAGGAGVVQVRDKHMDDGALAAVLLDVAAVAGAARVVVNDRLALAHRVAGVHLGVDDASPWEARARLGPDALIGATVNDLARLEALDGAPIDYVGVGAVRATASKGRPVPELGWRGLAALARRSPWPVIAIGGLGVADVIRVADAGAHGLAVIGAVALADDPCAATEALADAVTTAWG